MTRFLPSFTHDVVPDGRVMKRSAVGVAQACENFVPSVHRRICSVQ